MKIDKIRDKISALQFAIDSCHTINTLRADTVEGSTFAMLSELKVDLLDALFEANSLQETTDCRF